MKEQFINYEQALALKELGFDEPCFSTYHKELHAIIPIYAIYTNQDVIKAPLYQQAFRWFREKYGLNSHIHQESRNNYSYCCGQGYSDEIGGYQDFETYEEAELECLKKLIEIANEQHR